LLKKGVHKAFQILGAIELFRDMLSGGVPQWFEIRESYMAFELPLWPWKNRASSFDRGGCAGYQRGPYES
jgi:hypothetical protein